MARPRGKSFAKGKSGNPAGRPKGRKTEAGKLIADVKALAKEYTAEALDTLVKVMRDEKAPPAAKSGAAATILDRGWGKPAQQIEAKIDIFDRFPSEDRAVMMAALQAALGEDNPVAH